MTVTRRLSPSASSITVPKMTSASSPASSWMTPVARVASRTPSDVPAVMLTSTLRAPEMDTPPNSGLEMASRAARSALPSPWATAAPINAVPPSTIVVRTSAKSRLIRPWTVISSEMPRVAS